MKKKISPILSLLCIGLFLYSFTVEARGLTNTTTDNSTADGTFRVMCYNIHHCDPPYNTGDATDIDTIIGVIAKQNPDVVALQEVDVYTRRSGSTVHQAKVIADQLGMFSFFAPAIDYQGGKYGVALLSKYPLSELQLLQLPRPNTTGEKRVLATAKITLPDGTDIRLGCTHFDLKVDNKRAQVDKVNDVATTENLPFILAGDLNANEGSVVINRLDQVFTRTCTNCPLTSPARSPKNAIDYIAYRDPQNILTITNHKAVNETYASDHRPIVADFTYVQKPSGVSTPQLSQIRQSGRSLIADSPTDVSIYNLLGVVLLQQKNTTYLEIPERLGYGVFILSTKSGLQKILIK